MKNPLVEESPAAEVFAAARAFIAASLSLMGGFATLGVCATAAVETSADRAVIGRERRSMRIIPKWNGDAQPTHSCAHGKPPG